LLGSGGCAPSGVHGQGGSRAEPLVWARGDAKLPQKL